jgi:hypothetical protein
MDFCIGTDILDIGSRRAEIKSRQQHQRLQNDFMNPMGPTHFDVPNVSNVCNFILCSFIIRPCWLYLLSNHSTSICHITPLLHAHTHSRPCFVTIILPPRVGIQI